MVDEFAGPSLIRIPFERRLRFPVLAYWQPGAGRAVAFTSDAGNWARDWAKTPVYARFWAQAVEWALRSPETGRVAVYHEVRDGRVRLVVDVLDETDKPLAGASLKAFVSPPREGAPGPGDDRPRVAGQSGAASRTHPGALGGGIREDEPSIFRRDQPRAEEARHYALVGPDHPVIVESDA